MSKAFCAVGFSSQPWPNRAIHLVTVCCGARSVTSTLVVLESRYLLEAAERSVCRHYRTHRDAAHHLAQPDPDTAHETIERIYRVFRVFEGRFPPLGLLREAEIDITTASHWSTGVESGRPIP